MSHPNVTTNMMLQIQQSKSLEFNSSNFNSHNQKNFTEPPFKQQKKLESKNLQILQNQTDTINNASAIGVINSNGVANNNNQSVQQKTRNSRLANDDQSSQQSDSNNNSVNGSAQGRLKNHAWAKGTAKQSDPIKNKKKINQNQGKKQGDNSDQEAKIIVRKSNTEAKKTESIESANIDLVKEDSQSSQAINKKKRNKKKSKLTDTDIMNNFMKSLHSTQDEAKEADNKSSSNFSQSYKKKPIHETRQNYQKPQAAAKATQQQTQMDLISESQQSSVKSNDFQQNSDDQKSQTNHNSQPQQQQQQKSYKQKYAQKNSQSSGPQNSSDVRSNQNKRSDDEEQPQQSSALQEQSQAHSQTPIYQVKKSSTTAIKTHNKPQNKPKAQNKVMETANDDKDSASSNKADYISDDKSSKSCSEKAANSEYQQNLRIGAFRQLNFQTAANECESTSFTDLTGTTNTAVDTSLENNLNLQSHSKYQSYQNTPSKAIHPKNYHKQNTNHSLQTQDQEAANFRTPPQLSKKQSTQSNYSNNGSNYRKSHHNTTQHNQTYVNSHPNIAENQYNTQNQGYSQTHNGTNKNTQRAQGQYRQTNRTGAANNVYVQQMNLSQSMQEQRQFMQAFMNPENNNIFYQDQSMLVNSNQNVDTQNKAQEGVFQYVEKNPMMVQQPLPCYSPNQFQVNNQYAPAQGAEMIPNPFSSYQRMNVPYFDQSQDLIFQIFNSIKSNHSMSPIPQMISPPPLLDFQISQSSDLSLQAQRTDSYGYNPQEVLFYQTLDNEILSFTKSIEDSLNSLKPERDYVYNKLVDIANQVFVGQSPKLELFGSLITGLALESSDMDLAVTGLQIDDRFIMVSELNKLAQALQDWQCLESFKSIETASIPVIKMKVDLVKLREMEMTEREEGDFTKRPVQEDQRYLSVDITFDDSPISQCNGQNYLSQDILNPTHQTKTHLGLQSCALVQHYISCYKNLKYVAILLKKYLSEHKMNSPYYGGISSYSTVILVVAYMNYYGLRSHHELTPSRLLMGFLDFYAHYFNPGSMGISVYDDGSFFQLNSLLDSNFVILDPLNLQNNTTRNSYHTKEILLKFQCAFNNLKSLMFKLPSLQQAVFSQTAFSRANSQDQKSSITFDRASPQHSNFQINACNIQQTSNSQYQQNANQEVEVGSDQIRQKIVLEENEASNLALGAFKDSQINQTLNNQVCLLETFFAKDAQPVDDLSGMSSGQTEPRGTQITMIEEAHVE